MLAIAACKEETPYMELSQKKFTIGEEGGRINVELKANVYYRVVNENDFVTISAEGNDAETANYIIDVKANENIDARKARIKFIGDRVTPLALDITQKGKVPVGVDVSELNVSFSATSAEFRVLGDKEWTATCDNPDFVLSKTSGVGESKVEVTFPANTKEAPVTAVVTVTIGGQDYTLTITQEAAPAKERTDLGADGTSNCYIVSKPGYYKFKATVRGNGTLPESCDGEITVSITPDHADVLWCTYNTMTAPTAAAEIIPAVALNGDYIEFETPMNDITPANAIIAAYAADNTILWTWLFGSPTSLLYLTWEGQSGWTATSARPVLTSPVTLAAVVSSISGEEKTLCAVPATYQPISSPPPLNSRKNRPKSRWTRQPVPSRPALRTQGRSSTHTLTVRVLRTGYSRPTTTTDGRMHGKPCLTRVRQATRFQAKHSGARSRRPEDFRQGQRNTARILTPRRHIRLRPFSSRQRRGAFLSLVCSATTTAALSLTSVWPQGTKAAPRRPLHPRFTLMPTLQPATSATRPHAVTPVRYVV